MRYFDNLSGTGVITVPALKRDIFVHWSGVYGACINRPKTKWIELERLQQVKVQIYNDSHFEQVEHCKLYNWTTAENILSDNLLKVLQDDSKSIDFYLNNVLSDIDRTDK